MKTRIQKWLGIPSITIEIDILQKKIVHLNNEVSELQKELGRTQKFIGAIFDYLEVRPQRTFVQDFSRLPEDAIPTMEVIKVNKIIKKSK